MPQFPLTPTTLSAHIPLATEDKNININKDLTCDNLPKIKKSPPNNVKPNTKGLSLRKLKIVKGIIFCTVKINHILIQLILGSILVSQLCMGGNPSLKKIDNVIKIIATLIFIERNNPNTNINEAALWEIKYFTPVRIESSVIEYTSTGIMQSIFTSKHTHWPNILLTLKDLKIHTPKSAR